MTNLPPLPGYADDLVATGQAARLFDDRGRPDFREVYGALSRRATALDVALTRIRLSTLDLTEAELGGMRRVHLLLAEVSAAALDAEAHALLNQPASAVNLRRLAALLYLGRIEVRSAPLGGWAPDFSIFRDDGGPFALLVGPHRFDRGGVHAGPVLASLHGRTAAARTTLRFRDLWARAHDIGPAVLGILQRAERRSPPPDREIAFSEGARAAHAAPAPAAAGRGERSIRTRVSAGADGAGIG